MRVQIISNDTLDHLKENGIVISSMDSPTSLDEFDINIIDLSFSTLWRDRTGRLDRINLSNDLASIRQMAERASKTSLLFVYPQNCHFLYSYSSSCHQDYGYREKKPIKDCLPLVTNIISQVLPFAVQSIPVFYENTTTTIDDIPCSASFYFDSYYSPLTQSNKSQKPTTVCLSEGVFLTTLKALESIEVLLALIKLLLPHPERENAPQWARDIKILNDTELSLRIEEAEETIKQNEEVIRIANQDLQENARIKSILYTNGAELVEVVFSILEKLLSCDLSEFEDEKKEDFLIKKEMYTLIGEIKGVTSNVKNEHISQVDVHYQGYMDKLAEDGTQENVHQVLVMNPFRNKPLYEREPVHDTQIKLAERNGCLIIETATLLKLYEKFVAGGIDVATCEKLFTENTGLLNETDF